MRQIRKCWYQSLLLLWWFLFCCRESIFRSFLFVFHYPETVYCIVKLIEGQKYMINVRRYLRRSASSLAEGFVGAACKARSLARSLTHSLTYGAEPFLRNRQLCSYQRTSRHFKESEGSLPCSQEPSTGPYPEPDQSNPYHAIQFNIVHTPTCWSSQWSLSFWLSHQYPICLPILPLRATCLAHLDLLDLIILIITGEE
jgi:hypothetical protein